MRTYASGVGTVSDQTTFAHVAGADEKSARCEGGRLFDAVNLAID